MQRFTELKVWQKAHALVLRIYRVTAEFPEHERFGLISQLRRASVSIPCNIAEGSKRRSRSDYARFLNIAEGSAAEAEYLIMLSFELGYVSSKSNDSLIAAIDEVAKMLWSLRDKVSPTR